MKIGIVSGSARPSNNTLRVAKAIAKNLERCTIIDFQQYDIPGFADYGNSLENKTEFQKELISILDNSDLVFILTPEYNWFPSAEIIHMIHTLGNDKYKHLFDDTVFATIGVSSGRGGRMPAVQLGYVLNKVISYFSLNSVVSPKNFEAQEVTLCIQEDGLLKDNEMFNEGFKSFLSYSVKLAKRWQVSS